MTEEEKKEFEEFLQWKKEKAEKEQKEKTANPSEKSEEIIDVPTSARDEKGGDSSAPIPEQEKNNTVFEPIMIVILVVLGIFVLFIAMGTCSHGTKTQEPIDEFVEADSIEEIVTANPEPVNTTKTWDFTIRKDEMTDTKNIWATIQSDDYITQDFPYNGSTYASITVRYMKKYGYDVLIHITKGQINGSDYYGTDYVTARFDDGAPKKYRFNEAADGSSDHIFLRNSSDFISRCKKAKDIKIDIPVYQAGRPVFSFHVDEPLVWREE